MTSPLTPGTMSRNPVMELKMTRSPEFGTSRTRTSGEAPGRDQRTLGSRFRVAGIGGLLVLSIASPEQAAVLALRPGPIDRPRHFLTADFDRDGYPDLAIANFQAGTVDLLINQRDGTFAPHATSPLSVGVAGLSLPTSGPMYLAVVDFNPDDVDSDDVLNAVDNCPNVPNPPPTGSTIQTDTSPMDGVGDECQVAIDTDGDGVDDYDASTASLDNCPRLPNPLQEDLNLDGVGDACASSPDLLILGTSIGSGSPFGIVRVRLNNGSGGMVSRPSRQTGVGPGEVQTADFDGDGLADFVVSNSVADSLQLFRSLGNGSFNLEPIIATGAGPQGIAIADFNGDGKPDLATGNRRENTVGIYLNTGTTLPTQATAVLSPQPPTTVLAQPTVLLADRLGGPADPFADLLVLDQGGAGPGLIEIFLGSAAGPASTPGQTIDLGAGRRPAGGVLADFDADGWLDLAVTEFVTGEVWLFRNDGTGSFPASPDVVRGGFRGPIALAALDYDDAPGSPGADSDLAVLGFDSNRVDLIRNDGGFTFSIAPTTPVSPWKNSVALSVFGADALSGADIALLNGAAARLDVLSGLGSTFFRTLPARPFTSITAPSSMTVTDVRLDGRQDLVVLDRAAGQMTLLTKLSDGSFSEETALVIAPDPAAIATGPLFLSSDFDRDGVPNNMDNCPTVYNPPNCRVDDPLCPKEALCPTMATDCMMTSGMSQCDSDGNGVGDHCQTLTVGCLAIDTDGDGVLDYDPSRVPISTPPVLALDNCPYLFNQRSLVTSLQADEDTDGVGDACQSLNRDLVAVSPSDGSLVLLTSDGTGDLRAAPSSPISGLSNPSAAVVGGLSLACTPSPLVICNAKPTNDILVAEAGLAGSGDDTLTLYTGDGAGNFTLQGSVPAQGDPSLLRLAPDQLVCDSPSFFLPPASGLHFDADNLSAVVAVAEPGTSSIGVALVSNNSANPNGLVTPPGHATPLPLPHPPSDLLFQDLNLDLRQDIVAVGTDETDPANPTFDVTIYFGLGNGLFYTDPTSNLSGIPGRGRYLGAGQLNLAASATDGFYPDIVVFDAAAGAPVILLNVLRERADIDGSGRVDGHDLALLARAYGAVRGEDFTIQADGTLLATGTGPADILIGSGVQMPGHDLPSTQVVDNAIVTTLCNRALEPLSGFYGLAVDINLDGMVDGDDLALLASLFGARF